MRHLIKLSTVVVVLIGTWTMTLAAQEQNIKLVRFDQPAPTAPIKAVAIDLSVKPLSLCRCLSLLQQEVRCQWTWLRKTILLQMA